MKFFVFIIIYNKDCTASESCCSIPYDNDAEVCVFDNSNRENLKNKEYCQTKNWQYEWMGGNVGLSRAYNKAIERVQGAEEGIIVWFDDDTTVCGDYFFQLKAAAESDEHSSVFLPVVTNQGLILSPSRITGHKSERVSDAGTLRQEDITGINSGMAIRTRVFQGYRYDERLFLDCVDHQFMKDCKKRGLGIAVFCARLEQNYSQTNTSLSLESVRHRMKLFDRDFKIYCSDTLAGRFYYCVNFLHRRARYAAKWLTQKCRPR